MARVGAYPGSFNPLTVAHLAIAEAAVDQHRLDRLDLVLSRVSLGKEAHPDMAPIHERVAAIEAVAATRPWLTVTVSEAQLLVDLAEGYDVVVMGADKWAQVHDPAFYGDDPAARDLAVARLPRVAVAPRPPHAAPPALLLPVPDWVHRVSATAVREGRVEWRADPSTREGRRPQG